MGSWTVLQLTDIHLGAEPGQPVHGLHPDARLEQVIDTWRTSGERADMVLLTGDLTEDASAEALERLAACLAPLGAPIVALPGNHDDGAPLDRYFDTAAVTTLGPWSIICVDTTVPGEISGRVDVDATLEQVRRSEGFGLLAMHHPPLSNSTHEWFLLDGAMPLLDALSADGRVRAIVAGHTHEAFDATAGTMSVLGAPSTFIGFRHAGEEFRVGQGPTGARILQLDTAGTVSSRVLSA